MDTIEIANELEALVAGVSSDGKHFSQWESSIAVADFNSLDFSQPMVSSPVECQALHFNGRWRACAVGKCEWHVNAL
ncbi:MAG: hypothetical protein IT425_04370 [Pirellulales bacterium]|nr:hypothetical protein [Pirellulales bacterium]